MRLSDSCRSIAIFAMFVMRAVSAVSLGDGSRASRMKTVNVPRTGGRAPSIGSDQQARAFVDLGFRLGFGGAATFDRALQIRELARSLPLSAIVVETDSPDIPPHWLYRTAAQRAETMLDQPAPR